MAAIVWSAFFISIGTPTFLLSFFNPDNIIKDVNIRRALILLGFLAAAFGIGLFQFSLQNGG
jgi:hypothetical protein